MMKYVMRANRWYDGLAREHGTARFLLFFVPMAALILLIQLPFPTTVRLVALVVMSALALCRIVYMVVPVRIRRW